MDLKTAESNQQVYRVHVWQKTQVSQGNIFSAICYLLIFSAITTVPKEE